MVQFGLQVFTPALLHLIIWWLWTDSEVTERLVNCLWMVYANMLSTCWYKHKASLMHQCWFITSTCVQSRGTHTFFIFFMLLYSSTASCWRSKRVIQVNEISHLTFTVWVAVDRGVGGAWVWVDRLNDIYKAEGQSNPVKGLTRYCGLPSSSSSSSLSTAERFLLTASSSACRSLYSWWSRSNSRL